MKKFCLTTAFAASLLIFSNGIMAQSQLDQVKLIQQFVGTWQRDVGKDSLILWEVQQFNKAFVSTDYRVYSGKKSFWYTSNWSFIPKEGKFKGHNLYAGGSYQTWIASFTSEKRMSLSIVRDFNPEAVLSTAECVFENPTSFLTTYFNLKGEKTGEVRYSKIK